MTRQYEFEIIIYDYPLPSHAHRKAQAVIWWDDVITPGPWPMWEWRGHGDWNQIVELHQLDRTSRMFSIEHASYMSFKQPNQRDPDIENVDAMMRLLFQRQAIIPGFQLCWVKWRSNVLTVSGGGPSGDRGKLFSCAITRTI